MRKRIEQKKKKYSIEQRNKIFSYYCCDNYFIIVADYWCRRRRLMAMATIVAVAASHCCPNANVVGHSLPGPYIWCWYGIEKGKSKWKWNYAFQKKLSLYHDLCLWTALQFDDDAAAADCLLLMKCLPASSVFCSIFIFFLCLFSISSHHISQNVQNFWCFVYEITTIHTIHKTKSYYSTIVAWP